MFSFAFMEVRQITRYNYIDRIISRQMCFQTIIRLCNIYDNSKQHGGYNMLMAISSEYRWMIDSGWLISTSN